MNKTITEVLRKSIHISSLVLPLSYRYLIHDRKLMFIILLVINVLTLLIEYFRMEHRTVKKLFYRTFGIMLRKHEIKDQYTGALYLITSATVCVAFFPKDIAFVALAMLSIGDTFAAIIGMLFGKRKLIGHKSLEGSLACFITTFTFALFFLHPLIAMIGALVATIVELSDIPLDDNVRIPIASGIAMSIVWLFVI